MKTENLIHSCIQVVNISLGEFVSQPRCLGWCACGHNCVRAHSHPCVQVCVCLARCPVASLLSPRCLLLSAACPGHLPLWLSCRRASGRAQGPPQNTGGRMLSKNSRAWQFNMLHESFTDAECPQVTYCCVTTVQRNSNGSLWKNFAFPKFVWFLPTLIPINVVENQIRCSYHYPISHSFIFPNNNDT